MSFPGIEERMCEFGRHKCGLAIVLIQFIHESVISECAYLARMYKVNTHMYANTVEIDTSCPLISYPFKAIGFLLTLRNGCR
jgi:hypothetical protein